MIKVAICLFLLTSIVANATPLSYERYDNVHVLIVEPKECLITPVKADGKETVPSLAEQYGAPAAINGGFWKEDGSPAGILKIFHEWYGFPVKPRGAIGWSLDGKEVLIDRVLTDDNHYILPLLSPERSWEELPHVVGGTPVLIKNGALIEDYSEERTILSFLTDNHARTAIGIRETGEWVVVVIDRNPLNFFKGISIRDLAELMLDLGCIEAVNLDGGSSSVMVFNNAIASSPYKGVREVSDAILFIPKAL